MRTTASSGPDLHRADLTGEAVRLTRAVHRLLPNYGEVAGLLALMLLTAALPRRPGGPARRAPMCSTRPLSWSATASASC
jgi:predicted RNA polymerase sigma factor